MWIDISRLHIRSKYSWLNVRVKLISLIILPNAVSSTLLLELFELPWSLIVLFRLHQALSSTLLVNLDDPICVKLFIILLLVVV